MQMIPPSIEKGMPDTINVFLSLIPGPSPLEIEFTQMRYRTEKENSNLKTKEWMAI